MATLPESGGIWEKVGYWVGGLFCFGLIYAAINRFMEVQHTAGNPIAPEVTAGAAVTVLCATFALYLLGKRN